MAKKEIPTISVGQLRNALAGYADDVELSFNGLTYYRVKRCSDTYVLVEFNEIISLDDDGQVQVQNLE